MHDHGATVALVIVAAIFVSPFVLKCVHTFTLWIRNKFMPDFTAFNAATAELTATTARVQTAFAALDDASVQAQVDAGTQAVQAANTALTALAPVPPVTDPAA